MTHKRWFYGSTFLVVHFELVLVKVCLKEQRCLRRGIHGNISVKILERRMKNIFLHLSLAVQFKQCDQIWRKFATLVEIRIYLAIA